MEPMELSKVAIRTDGTITTVIVDGVDVSKRATKVCFEHTAGEMPIVMLTIPVDDLTVEGSIGVAIRNGRAGDDELVKEIAAPVLEIQGRQDLKQQINSILKEEMAEDLASSAHTHEW